MGFSSENHFKFPSNDYSFLSTIHCFLDIFSLILGMRANLTTNLDKITSRNFSLVYELKNCFLIRKVVERSQL